jgi:DNA polymerase-3 subunit delta'
MLMLCPNPHASNASGREACGQCQSCNLSRADNHPDLHIVHRRLNAFHPDLRIRNQKALDISVDVVRHFLIDPAGLAPAMGHGKVFIIREADRITSGAQNALLKTLEEPPPATFLMLLVSSLDRLLPTTRSRCQIVPFGPLPTAFVADIVASQHADLSPEAASFYATLAGGSAAGALRYAEDDLLAFAEQLGTALANLTPERAAPLVKSILDFAKAHAGAYRERDPELSDTAALRQALAAVFVLLANWYRDRLHHTLGSSELAGGAALADESVIAPDAAAHAVRIIAEAEGRLALNVNAQLAVEGLVFQLAALSHMPQAAFL